MNANPLVPPTTPRRRFRKRHVFLAAFLVVLLAGGLTVVNILHLSADTRALRDVAVKAVGGKCDKKFALHAGGVVTGLVRVVAGFLKPPPEAHAALQAVRSADVGVYELSQPKSCLERAELLTTVDATMQRRGWARAVGVINGADLVAVYIPTKPFSLNRVKCSIVVLNNRNLIVVSANGNLAPLMDLARRELEAAMKPAAAGLTKLAQKPDEPLRFEQNHP